jgi:CRP-like cAMP-binding protein
METLLLRRVDLFQGFDDEELTRIAAVMRPLVLPPHRVLYRRGDPATGCYVLLGGSVELTYGGLGGAPGPVMRPEPGSLLGEVSLVDGGPRTATCAAGTQGARVAMLTRADYFRLSASPDPLGFKLLDGVTRAIVEQLQVAPAVLQRAMLCR